MGAERAEPSASGTGGLYSAVALSSRRAADPDHLGFRPRHSLLPSLGQNASRRGPPHHRDRHPLEPRRCRHPRTLDRALWRAAAQVLATPPDPRPPTSVQPAVNMPPAIGAAISPASPAASNSTSRSPCPCPGQDRAGHQRKIVDKWLIVHDFSTSHVVMASPVTVAASSLRGASARDREKPFSVNRLPEPD